MDENVNNNNNELNNNIKSDDNNESKSEDMNKTDDINKAEEIKKPEENSENPEDINLKKEKDKKKTKTKVKKLDKEPNKDKTEKKEIKKESVLEVRNITKFFGIKQAVKNASFSMKVGEIVGLLGPNGAGKTTIFYMIVGFIKPTFGDIYLDHHKITNVQMFKRAQLGISYLSQEASIFRKLTVEENIEAVLENLDIPDQEKNDRKISALEDLGITHLSKQKAFSLSGGERRRTEIARALVLQPKFLLMDEPFAGIDPIAVYDIQQIISGLKKKGIGVLITDHNVRETLSITDRAYIINLGDIFRAGTSHELVDDQMVRKLYLGEKFTF